MMMSLLGGTVAGTIRLLSTSVLGTGLGSLLMNFTAGTCDPWDWTAQLNSNVTGGTDTVTVGNTDIITISGGTLNAGTLSLATALP